MAAPDYEVRDFDMATARERFRVVPSGQPYDSVTVLAFPAGGDAQLHFGDNRQGVPVIGAGLTFNISARDSNGCPVPPDEGLFLTNSASAGTLRLLISFSGFILTGGL